MEACTCAVLASIENRTPTPYVGGDRYAHKCSHAGIDGVVRLYKVGYRSTSPLGREGGTDI